MKCADCNGVIEGRRSFCPHCGRNLTGNPFSFRNKNLGQPSVSWREQPIRPAASKNVQGISISALKAATGNPAKALPSIKLIRPIIASIIGAAILGFLPGHNWVMGAFIGLFLGLPRKKLS